MGRLPDVSLPRANGDRLDPKDGPVLVSIHYFKPTTGKWYCEDESVEWKPDATHFDGWQPFSQLHRLKDMTAVCLLTPLGFPQSSPGDLSKWGEPTRCDAVGDAYAKARQLVQRWTERVREGGVDLTKELSQHAFELLTISIGETLWGLAPVRLSDVTAEVDHALDGVSAASRDERTGNRADVPQGSTDERGAERLHEPRRGGPSSAQHGARDESESRDRGPSVVGRADVRSSLRVVPREGASSGLGEGVGAGETGGVEAELRAKIAELEDDVLRLLHMVRAGTEEYADLQRRYRTLVSPEASAVISPADRSVARATLLALEERSAIFKGTREARIDFLARYFATYRSALELAAPASFELGENYRAAIGTISDMRQALTQFVASAEARIAEYTKNGGRR